MELNKRLNNLLADFHIKIIRKGVLHVYTPLIYSQNQLYIQIVNYSLYNCTTIICENDRYFMNKCDIFRDDWNGLINILHNIYTSTQHTLIDR